eukprot:GFUD01021699.1.p1 GENE.GFUD01021699.1~~GFUD01021699.1.p1  ORF type:complete len:464 (-),score=119.40 GFUD01021699.1:86-1477(-)
MKSSGGNDAWWQIVLQVFPTYLMAGCGMVGAGLLLDYVQYWPAFVNVPEIIIVVPPLLGLKGNLEMTLAARLSTAAHLGHLDDRKVAISTIVGNLILVQCQGIVVGFLASLCGLAMGWLPVGKANYEQALLLCASAMVTASLASFILALIMVFVIVLARRCNCNPDNIATPIAASLGDITTLGLLAWISDILFNDYNIGGYKAQIIIGGYFLVLPLFLALAYNNEHVAEVLRVGWTPVLMAMLIASGGGFVLEMAVEHFKGVTLFAPVMNGSGGDLVGIQASRMTTYLNKATNSLIGTFPEGDNKTCQTPCSALCGDISACSKCGGGTKQPHAMPARVLLSLLFPGHILFVFIIFTVKIMSTPSFLFLFFYLIAATIQVAVLLYLCQLLVYWMWSRGTDPDNAAIPYLTAIGDLIGTSLLALAFLTLEAVGDTSLENLEDTHHVGHNITEALNATISHLTELH